MVIGIVTPVYPPYRGGVGVVAQREALALQERGVHVDVYVPPLRHGLKPEGTEVHVVQPLWHNGHTAIMPRLFWRLKDVDVIYLHYPFYGAEIFAMFAAWIWRKPLVLRYHMRARVRGWRRLVYFVHRLFVEPFVLLTADTILVSSLDYATSLGLSSKKLKELPFGVDTDVFVPSEAVTPDVKGLIRFLFVGGMDRPHYFKGVPELLKACATLPKEGWHLTLVGDGELRASYEGLAATYQIADHVTFAGRVSQDKLIRLFQDADVHVLPSINHSEAFGLVTLEAGACGCASIVSDLPGVRTLVEDGKTGYIVKPGHVGSLSSALVRCLDDHTHVRVMGEAARRRIKERYDEQQMMDQLYENWHHL